MDEISQQNILSQVLDCVLILTPTEEVLRSKAREMGWQRKNWLAQQLGRGELYTCPWWWAALSWVITFVLMSAISLSGRIATRTIKVITATVFPTHVAWTIDTAFWLLTTMYLYRKRQVIRQHLGGAYFVDLRKD
jgi:hypothetical protein